MEMKTLLIIFLIFTSIYCDKIVMDKAIRKGGYPPLECIGCIVDNWMECNTTACNCLQDMKTCFNNVSLLCHFEYFWLEDMICVIYDCPCS